VIPVASPASAVIRKLDPSTGDEEPVNSTLGPIFTERAETIGKGKAFIGVSHQDFHFTSINGQSLNGLTILIRPTSTIGPTSTAPSNTPAQGTTQPATFQLASDVRLSQDLAFFTYGLTDRIDASIGLPTIHSAVAAWAYNGIVYTGDGLGGKIQPGSNCWCINTLAPGNFQVTKADIGHSQLAKTGVGDLLVRLKYAAVEHSNAVVSIGTDLRFPTGDASNYLGTGTTSVKPFLAVSLYRNPSSSGVVISPHFNLGWQFSGRSVLGGTISGTPGTATLAGNETVYISGPGLTVTHGYLPDVFQWSGGTEFAIDRRNTVVLDVLGNQIGWIHGAQLVTQDTETGYSPYATENYAQKQVTGLVGTDKSGSFLRGSFGQYSGSVGYKFRVKGGLVATFNALFRINNAGLTARFVPLYGLSYSFN
jgi:hypothetical protein